MEALARFLLNLVINADVYLQFVLLLGVLMMIFTPWQKISRRLTLYAAIPFLIISLSPLPRYGFIHLENRYPRVESLKDDFYGFILLGGAIDKFLTSRLGEGRVVYEITMPRLVEFATLAKKHPDKPIIFTGTPDEVTYEVKALVEMGIDKNRITAYPNALNTIDNAQNTFKDYKPKPDQKFVLVTSAFHMPRSMGLFQAAGWNVEAYPLDYHTIGKYEQVPLLMFFDRRNLLAWHVFTKEWECMVNNYLSGRSKVFFPGPVKP